MEITEIRIDDELSHIALSGRLDANGIKTLDLKFYGFTSGRHKNAIVDMSGVDFMSSIGVRMILKAAKALNAEGLKFVLLSPTEFVREVLDTAGLLDIFIVADDLDAAMQQL